MTDLKERVQRMLDGENKRREVALKFINEVEKVLLPVAEDIWGTGDNFDSIPSNAIILTKIDKEGKKKDTEIYFRYVEFRGTTDNEWTGFYDGTNTYMNVWGKDIAELRGKDFWYCIQIIIDWIPQVIEAMEKRQISRDQLLSKIKITA